MNGEELYNEYADRVYKYLLSITSGNYSLAEELTQDTMFKAITKANQYTGEANIFTYLCAIAKNAYISHLRKEKRRAKGNEADIDNISVEVDFLAGEGEKEIYKAVHSLPEPYKELILLRIHTDMTFEQIGEIFGKSENWARVTFYRGKEKLKEILNERN